MKTGLAALVLCFTLTTAAGSGLAPVLARSASMPGAAHAQRLLWQTNWRHGLQGWHRSGSGQVTVSGGTLHFLGDDRVQLYAPYRVTRSKYALEAEIRFLQPLSCCNQNFGITLRGYNCCNAGIGTYMCGGGASAYIDRSFGNAECNDISADTSWHDYRVEVRGNHAILKQDGVIIQQVTDNHYLYVKHGGYQFNGSVGLEMGFTEVDVRVFKIYALR